MPLIFAVLSLLLYYLALPPFGWWPLVFIAPAFWVPLVEMKKPERPRRFYWPLYLAAVAFWGTALLWLPLPHWGVWFGWVAISFYLAIWFPLFIAAARILVHRGRVPIFFALPFCWIGAEWFRFHVLDGFTFCALQHALYLKPALIQSASFFGEYAVGALIVLAGTCLGYAFSPVGKKIERFVPHLSRRSGEDDTAFALRQQWANRPTSPERRVLALLGFMLILALNHYFGAACVKTFSDTPPQNASSEKPLRVALIQDGEPLWYPLSLEVEKRIHGRYMSATDEALARYGAVDLVVWPEGTFAVPFYAVADGGNFPGTETLDDTTRKTQIDSILAEQEKPFADWVTRLGVPVLVGGMIYDYNAAGIPTVYNTAIFRAPNGETDRYDKVQRVLFGEYVPFVEWLPEGFPLKTLCTPIGAGKRDGVFHVGGRTFTTSICFESSLPHFYARQIDFALKDGTSPDFMLNISNDGWFRGGVENKLHRATYVFRAIENRRWLLAAVHGDAALAVDPAGQIRAEGPKGETDSILVEFSPHAPAQRVLTPILHKIPALCALVLAILWLTEFLRRRRENKNEK